MTAVEPFPNRSPACLPELVNLLIRGLEVGPMPPSVATFTDTYLPTVNGVTYTISSWRERYLERNGRMDVVYPASSYKPASGEYPVWSLPFPFYSGYRLGVPRIPDPVTDVDLVHAHTPFSVGLGGYRLARKEDLPLVVSYHTPTREYARYVAPPRVDSVVAAISERYELWFLRRADLVLAPSGSTAANLRDALPDHVPVEAHPNGVNIRHFRQTASSDFTTRYDLPDDRDLIGYTGRHGYEKNLEAIIKAADGLDVTVVFGGEGPATPDLEELAREKGVDARFLGFLDREELPAFYSALDVFAFPSPVETQGIVALEANACGTPVVGVNRGALADTIEDGTTGYHFEHGDIEDFRKTLSRALEEREALSDTCLQSRETISLEESLETLETAYSSVLEDA